LLRVVIGYTHGRREAERTKALAYVMLGLYSKKGVLPAGGNPRSPC